jgi:MFS family permease
MQATGKPKREEIPVLKWFHSRPRVLARHLMPALAHSDCRRLEGSLAFLTVWNSIVQIALPWLMYEKTGSKLALGVSLALQLIPQTILLPWCGWIADRFPRRTTLLLTMGLLMLWSVVAFVLLATGPVSKWTLYGLIGASGTLWVIILPVASAYKREIFGSWSPQERTNAWYIDIGGGAAAAALGQFLASVVITFGGVLWVFAVGSLAILPFWLFVLKSQHGRSCQVVSSQPYNGLREAFAYLRKVRQVGGPLLMLGLINLCVGSISAFALPMAQEGLHNKGMVVELTTAFTLGRLAAVIGVMVAFLHRYVERMARWGVYGLAVAVYGLCGHFHLLHAAVLAIGCVGFLAGATTARTQKIVMNDPPPDFVGRLSTAEFAAKVYSSDGGDLAVGWLSNLVGIIPMTIGAGGVAMLISLVALMVTSSRNVIARRDNKRSSGQD